MAPAVDGPAAAAEVAVPAEAAEAAAARQAAGEQSYVVQQRFLHPVDGGGKEVVWVDVASVTVPARSKRSTIVRAALTSDGVVVSLPDEFRVLDAVAAEERYMAFETGIGSGRLWDAADLFVTFEEARAVCEERNAAESGS